MFSDHRDSRGVECAYEMNVRHDPAELQIWISFHPEQDCMES